jgi:hypothetical protein
MATYLLHQIVEKTDEHFVNPRTKNPATLHPMNFICVRQTTDVELGGHGLDDWVEDIKEDLQSGRYFISTAVGGPRGGFKTLVRFEIADDGSVYVE